MRLTGKVFSQSARKIEDDLIRVIDGEEPRQLRSLGTPHRPPLLRSDTPKPPKKRDPLKWIKGLLP